MRGIKTQHLGRAIGQDVLNFFLGQTPVYRYDNGSGRGRSTKQEKKTMAVVGQNRNPVPFLKAFGNQSRCKGIDLCEYFLMGIRLMIAND